MKQFFQTKVEEAEEDKLGRLPVRIPHTRTFFYVTITEFTAHWLAHQSPGFESFI